MAASYPSSVKTFTTKVDGAGNIIFAAHVNDLQDEVIAVEQGLLNGVAHDLKPSTDAARLLGASAFRWKQLLLGLGTITADQPAIDITGTWSAAGVVFTGIKANFTDGASQATSLLMDLQVGGATKFKVIKDGSVESAFKMSAQVFEGKAVTFTSDLNVLSLIPTWSNAGVTFTGIKMNVTDGGSAAASLLMDLQVGGSSKFKVDKSGKVTLGADPTGALDAATKQYVDGASSVSVLDTATSTIDVANTVTETDLYSFSVVGGTLGTTGKLRFRIEGDWLTNVAGTLTLRVKFGATTILTLSGIDVADSATRRHWIFDVDLSAKGATNAQTASGIFWIGAAAASGVMNFSAGFEHGLGGHESIAEDSTSAKTFSVTAQWSTASASLSIRRMNAKLVVEK